MIRRSFRATAGAVGTCFQRPKVASCAGVALAFTLSLASAAASQTVPPIELAKARAAFAEARAVCTRDNGRLWGKSLCGPIILVDPQTRFVVASQADADGVLKPESGVFTGRFPESVIISNTPTRWSGTFWTQLILPLPDDTATRQVMFAHELFHRIEDTLDGPKIADGDNRHLDTLEGRYWLQLEWRALARALQAGTEAERRAATSDALLFRAERYHRFPGAAAQEKTLELNEAIAEYTGVRVGLQTPKAREAYAVHDLSIHVQDDSFVRAFAYATGPAYGLLLDRADPAWRTKLNSAGLDQLLRAGLKIPAPVDPQAAAEARARAYDDGSLRLAEVARETERQKRQATFRARLLDGPVLILPTAHSNRQFRPTTLAPLGDLGVVYPTLRLTAAWGSLEVSGGSGALLRSDVEQATVSALGADPSGLKGDGWTLQLNAGWSVKPGLRPGDFAVTPDR